MCTTLPNDFTFDIQGCLKQKSLRPIIRRMWVFITMMPQASIAKEKNCQCSLSVSISPENPLSLCSTECQNTLRKLDLHPGEPPVREQLALSLHNLLQSTSEQRGCHDGIPPVINLIQGRFPQTLQWERDWGISTEYRGQCHTLAHKC